MPNEAIFRTIILCGIIAIRAPGLVAAELPLGGERYERFLEHPFLFVIGVTRNEVVRSLGPPKNYARKVERNRHDKTVRDVFQDFTYEGLEVRIAAFPGTNPPTVDLTEVRITSARYQLKYGLRVGSSRKQVRRILGRFDENTETPTWEYEAHDGYLSLRFTFDNDRVTKIEWFNEYD